jgi:hypothetical protein
MADKLDIFYTTGTSPQTGPQHNFIGVGRAWLSGANVPAGGERQFIFPRATRFFEITNATANGNLVRATFASTGSDANVKNAFHVKTIYPSGSFSSYSPVQNIWVHEVNGNSAARVEVYAELVDHYSGSQFNITGSGVTAAQ